LTEELWRNGPELLDLVSRLPELLSRLARLLDRPSPSPTVGPLAGLRGAIVAAACILGGVLTLLLSDAWPAGSGLLLVGFWCYERGG
jgi:ubiquinone biosynthesis protein